MYAGKIRQFIIVSERKMFMIYDPFVFYGYFSLLIVAVLGGIIFFWIVLGRSRVPQGLIFAHITMALVTYVFLIWIVITSSYGRGIH